MSIITLTTDFGQQDHYVAVLKGLIYARYPDVKLVDITHSIPDYDIMAAAYAVKSTFPAYPKGTVHLIGVDPEERQRKNGVVVKSFDQFFIGPDNGLISLICGDHVQSCVSIDNEDLFAKEYPHSFRAARTYAPCAAALAQSGDINQIGALTSLFDLRWGQPSYTDNCLRGKIIHIDKFGNAITNILKPEFLSIKEDRSFEIFIRNVRLKRIVSTYSDVGKADALAIFGESNHLEIALREASASDLLGLQVHDMITIEFRGNGRL